MMSYNIRTGYEGVERVGNEEIAIVVSSLVKLEELGVRYVFSDQHAYMVAARFYTGLKELGRLDWAVLQRRDFKRDENDLGKTDRYQAEALVWKHLPVEGILGIGCYSAAVRDELKARAGEAGVAVPVLKQTGWYFE